MAKKDAGKNPASFFPLLRLRDGCLTGALDQSADAYARGDPQLWDIFLSLCHPL